MRDENGEKKPGVIKQIAEVFKDKLKGLDAVQSAIVFVILSIIFTFGVIGFTAAVASAIVKLIQVIATVAGA